MRLLFCLYLLSYFGIVFVLFLFIRSFSQYFCLCHSGLTCLFFLSTSSSAVCLSFSISIQELTYIYCDWKWKNTQHFWNNFNKKIGVVYKDGLWWLLLLWQTCRCLKVLAQWEKIAYLFTLVYNLLLWHLTLIDVKKSLKKNKEKLREISRTAVKNYINIIM